MMFSLTEVVIFSAVGVCLGVGLALMLGTENYNWRLDESFRRKESEK